MKIWLDDERNPHEPYWIREKSSSIDMVWIKDPQEAIRLIETGSVTFISLDHDLGTELTGYDVAKVIARLAYFKSIPKIEWRIHTDNPVGFKNILQTLLKANEYWAK